MAARADNVLGLTQPRRSTDQNIIREPPKDSPDSLGADMTKAQEEAMQQATLAAMLAIPQMVVKNGTNGDKWDKRLQTIFIAGSLLFSVAWWTRGTERDTMASMTELRLELKSTHEEAARNKNAADATADEVKYLKTWNEKLRNNMAAMGWAIDPVTAEIRRKGR